MLSYPTYRVHAPDGQLNVLQITDMHLLSPASTDNAEDHSDEKPSCRHCFEANLAQALAEDIRCDLILVTGDLVSKVDSATYDHIFEVLHSTQIPFACIAGNHDVTDESSHDLPFEQRKLTACAMDPRLLSRHVIETDAWQLLLLDSSIPGQIGGLVTEADMDWLCAQLATCDKPALLAVHHHVMPMYSEWIDAHMIENADYFWQRLAPYAHLKVIVSGHTHQEQVHHRNGVTVYSTPSTCYQFMPYEDDFSYDKQAHAGYRWLQLANNGNLASWVKRLDTW